MEPDKVKENERMRTMTEAEKRAAARFMVALDALAREHDVALEGAFAIWPEWLGTAEGHSVDVEVEWFRLPNGDEDWKLVMTQERASQ
jgi:hypothetical protein